MRRKIYLLGVILAVILFGVVSCTEADCSTIRHREQYLNQLEHLNNVRIISETMIDNYVISGYISSNENYGIAIFEPVYKEKYKFQGNINGGENEILFSTVIINNVFYDLFWTNKLDIDTAQITYYIDSEIETYKLDAGNEKILYLQAPAKDYDVYVTFIDKNGHFYQ